MPGSRDGAAVQWSLRDYHRSRTTVLLVGDSHAEHLLPGLVETYPGLNLEIITVRSPKPFGSPAGVQAVVEYVSRQPSIGAVMYSRSLGRDGGGLSSAEEEGMTQTLRGLDPLGLPVFVLDDSPAWPLDMFSCTARRSVALPGTVCEWDRSYFEPRHRAVTADLTRVVGTVQNATVVSVHDASCDADVCRRWLDGEPLYSDGDHVTALGSQLLIEHAIVRHPEVATALGPRG
ncbi:SGNH hydrolase domain-containing protein [Tessaracoccus sp. Y1736]